MSTGSSQPAKVLASSRTSSSPANETRIPDSPPQARPHYGANQKGGKGGRWVAKEGGFRSNSPLKQGGSVATANVQQMEATKTRGEKEEVPVNAASTTYSARTVTPPRRHRRGNSYSDEEYDERGPRSFPWDVKEACWRKAETVPGRNPDRWRMDPYGNLVFKKLVACDGCLCHNYDHIQPFSKGGKSVIENCQLLQARANRVKSNRTDMTYSDISNQSAYCRFSKRDMDVVELAAYGNVAKTETPSGCFIS
ncbi:hypothetical protein KFL_001400190 [Klebsormidium nitens]|uniref:HNH domain-containing protein n=1 Tax=Klebsormidium nitens TaxID=105231 RepID=A0A1Y1HX61_KLENI|nr:hypothetical protein KFL_001400190 [Klebsormidium nitens]|eukprot:GAQ83235.1 hypothetical protein KFL_001400190 [Klebsormidium nitens]